MTPETVKLYVDPPSEYEVIGIVNAASDAGWTSQGDMNYAIAELKKQAAKLGANGVLITATGDKATAAMIVQPNGALLSVPTSAKSVQGKAIFVKAP